MICGNETPQKPLSGHKLHPKITPKNNKLDLGQWQLRVDQTRVLNSHTTSLYYGVLILVQLSNKKWKCGITHCQ